MKVKTDELSRTFAVIGLLCIIITNYYSFSKAAGDSFNVWDWGWQIACLVINAGCFGFSLGSDLMTIKLELVKKEEGEDDETQEGTETHK